MTFTEQLQTDLAVFINSNEFAESIDYHAYGEDAVTTYAVVVREEVTKEQIGAELYLVKGAVILIDASDLPTTPNPDGDYVYLDGDINKKWKVDSYKPVGQNVAHKVHATNKELVSFEA